MVKDIYETEIRTISQAKYQRALAWEMKQAGLEFNREIEQDIFYKDLAEPIGTRRADFVVENKVLLELKAIIRLEDVHLAQVLNYLKAIV